MINNIGAFAIPFIIFVILLYGILKGVPMFYTFIKGAKEGMISTASIAPSLIGLITAVSMIKASGALDIFTNLISPIVAPLGMPPELTPLAILRPISGSGSIALLDNLLTTYGADSTIGRIACVMMGSTETTFYTIAVYFGAAGIINSKHAIPSALIADLVTIVMSIITIKYMIV